VETFRWDQASLLAPRSSSVLHYVFCNLKDSQEKLAVGLKNLNHEINKN